MADVRNISSERAKRIVDNAGWLPRDALAESIREIDEGERAPDSILVLFLEEDGDGFSTSWTAANIRSSKMLSLMEMVKATILRDMGLT